MRTYDAFDFSKIRKEYSRVRLRTDRFANKNIPIGTIGAIIEIFCNGENMNYFVDFVDAHGDPLDWIEVGEEDIEPA